MCSNDSTKRNKYRLYLNKRIHNKKESNKLFKIYSLILLFFALILVTLPFFDLKAIQSEEAMKYATYGFGFISTLIPIYLQGRISKGKKDIIDLEFLKDRIEDIEDHILENALKSL